MTGFRNFVLKGNLIEIAVGLIMALAFAAVVTAFVAWLTSLMPDSVSNIFSDTRALRRVHERRRSRSC